MEKIKLKKHSKKHTHMHSGLNIHSPQPEMLTMHFNGEDVYTFSGDIVRIEEIIEWLYDNTTERFTFLGTENIYFESSQDAMAFKLRWT